MSSIDLSLDDIIARNRLNKKTLGQKSFKKGKISGRKIGGGLKKRTNASKNGGAFTKAVPTLNGRHDKFLNS
ncbi:hypothetical protein PENTCL1PPCAC_3100, partial [Pristionchus entomophagus]